MGLSVAHGAFSAGPNLDLDTDTTSNTYTVSGLAFQPKAIIFWWNGLQSATDATSESTSLSQGFGFATSTSDRRCAVVYSQDGAGSMTTGIGGSDVAAIALITTAGGLAPIVDIDAINSDGFRLIVDEAAATGSATIFWKALGGTDITNAATGTITEPAAIGNQSYTVGAGWQPTIALFAGSTSLSANIGDAGLMFGAATGTGSGNQFVVVNNQDQGSPNSDADRYMRGDECLAYITVAGGNPAARAQFNGFDSAGFDLNWVARAVTGRPYIYLALAAGSNVNVGTMTVDLTTLSNTTTVSGLSFQPEGGLIISHGTSEQAAGTSTTEGMLSVGSFTSTSSRQCQSFRDENGTGNAEINLGVSYDEVLQLLTASGTVDAEADINAINTDGFQLICADALGSNVFAGYIAFGNPFVATPFSYFFPSRCVRKMPTRSQKQRLI